MQTKRNAITDGLKTFNTGVPCKRGHIGDRNVRGGSCRECCAENSATFNIRNPTANREASRRHTAKDPRAKSAYHKQWRVKNAEFKQDNDHQYYLENTEAFKARAKAWNAANPETQRICVRNRRARLKWAGGHHTKHDIAELLIKQKSLCVYCQTDIFARYEVDHIMPVSKGGSNNPENLQLTCRSCNASKRDKDPGQFALERALIAA